MIELVTSLYVLGLWSMYVNEVKGRRRDKVLYAALLVIWPLVSLLDMLLCIWYFLVRENEDE